MLTRYAYLTRYESKLQGKITIGTEWGGGGMSHPSDYDSLYGGVVNSLRYLQMLRDGQPVGEILAHRCMRAVVQDLKHLTRAFATSDKTRPRPPSNRHRTAPGFARLHRRKKRPNLWSECPEILAVCRCFCVAFGLLVGCGCPAF